MTCSLRSCYFRLQVKWKLLYNCTHKIQKKSKNFVLENENKNLQYEAICDFFFLLYKCHNLMCNFLLLWLILFFGSKEFSLSLSLSPFLTWMKWSEHFFNISHMLSSFRRGEVVISHRLKTVFTLKTTTFCCSNLHTAIILSNCSTWSQAWAQRGMKHHHRKKQLKMSLELIAIFVWK